jgi:protein phosphatase
MAFSDDETAEFIKTERFSDTFFTGPTVSTQGEFGAATHPGLARSTNEDHYAVIRRSWTRDVLASNLPPESFLSSDEQAFVMVVADGIGGSAFGSLASRLAVQTVWELAGRATSWVMRFQDADAQQIHERIEAYVQLVEERLRQQSRNHPETAGMGTTWTSAYVTGRDVLIAHLGDSRAYVLRRGALEQLTHDHTLAQELIDWGMPREDVKRYGNILTNCFGGNSGAPVPELRHMELESGDMLLICSDGLTDMAADDLIAKTIDPARSPQDNCEALVQLALRGGGKDNVTAVLGRFEFSEEESIAAG